MMTHDKPDIPTIPAAAIDRPPRDFIVFGAYAVVVIALLTAAMARTLAGLKPGEMAVVSLAGALVARRVVRRDATFAVTPVDGGFALLILTGTVLPLLVAMQRQLYVTTDMFHALAGPLEYYLWYRVVLEAVPLPERLPGMMHVVLGATTMISAVGVLQIAHAPGVEHFLLQNYPTLETFESQFVHRATSLVGGWETLAALAAYALILINQMQLAEETAPTLGKAWRRGVFVMQAVNVVALVATLSVTGVIAIALGYGIAWRVNGRLARATWLALVGGGVALVALAPFVGQRVLAQLGAASGHGLTLPQTWATRFEHWQITLGTIFTDLPHALFGVQPSFAYPVLSFGSTESLYLLLLYRGGALYLLAFLAFMAVVMRQLWRARRGTTGFPRHMATAIVTIFGVNFAIDLLDAHLFGAGEAQFLFTLLALGVGISQQTPTTATQTVPSEVGTRHLTLPARVASAAIAAVLLLSLVAGGVALYRDRHRAVPPPELLIRTYDPPTATTRENQQPGTTAWEITPGTNTTFIQGYAGQVSALPGATVPLYISSQQPTHYDLDVYRIGWYFGLGAHRYRSVPALQSTAQGNWTPAAGLQHCTTCRLDNATHLLEANWAMSYDLAIPPTWPSGVYLIKLTAAAYHAASYIPLVVRSRQPHALILASLPVNTYAATNPWGGYDLAADYPAAIPINSTVARAAAVSFDRPYGASAGAGAFLDSDIYTVRWLERMGFDTAYTTNVDVDAQPPTPVSARIFLALGHDAYWTRSIRDGITSARDAGVNLAFLGAGDAYWQARLSSDSAGQPRRTLICYQVRSAATDPTEQLSRDPLYQTDPSLVTAPWRDPSLASPENALLGAMYAGTSAPGDHAPAWATPRGPLDALDRAAGLRSDQAITAGPAGFAYDAVVANGQTPPHLVTLAAAPLTGAAPATVTYYRAASGALVFDAGVSWWSWGLDESTIPGADHPNMLRGNQHIHDLTLAIIHAMAAG